MIIDGIPNNLVRNILIRYKNSFNGKYFHYCEDFGSGIPNEIISNARDNHEIDISEQVLLLIDTAEIYHNGKHSVLFLEKGLSIAFGDSILGWNKYFIEWSWIEDTIFKEGKYVFRFYPDAIGKDFIIDTKFIVGNESSGIQNIDLFINIVKLIVDEYQKSFEVLNYKRDLILSEFDNHMNKESYDEALKDCDNYISLFPIHYSGYIMSVKVLYSKGNINDAMLKIDKAIDVFNEANSEDESKWSSDTRNEAGEILEWYGKLSQKNNDIYSALWNYHFASLYYSDKKEKDKSIAISDELYNTYIKEFSSLKYENRNIIFIDKHLPDIKPDSFITLKYNSLPQISFPIGHPKIQELYIGHPFVPNVYFHINQFEVELFQDKLMELNRILQCLGAKKIKLKYIENEQTKENSSNGMNISGEASYITSISGNYKSDSKSKTIDKLKKQMNTEQSFAPKELPYLPENLIWYQHEITWQRLAEQRLKGNIISSKINLSLNTQNYFSGSEKRKVMADFKGLILNIKGTFDEYSYLEKDTEQDIEWLIDVEFEPKENLIAFNNNPIFTNSDNNLGYDNKEIEYIEILRDCYEDKNISTDERRILERQKIKLGISEERAKELEEFIKNEKHYTDSELEYIEEVKFCLLDDQVISSDEKRLLERLRSKLNIDIERAKDLEKQVINSLKL